MEILEQKFNDYIEEYKQLDIDTKRKEIIRIIKKLIEEIDSNDNETYEIDRKEINYDLKKLTTTYEEAKSKYKECNTFYRKTNIKESKRPISTFYELEEKINNLGKQSKWRSR